MNVQCFARDQSGQVTEVDLDEVAAGWRSGGVRYWVDAEDPERAARGDILEKLGLDPDDIGTALDPGHAPRVLPLAEALYFDLAVELSGDPPELRTIGFLCFENLLVTYGVVSASPAGDARGLAHAAQLLSLESTAEMTVDILLAWSLDLRRQSSELRLDSVRLAAALDSDASEITPRDIQELKRRSLDLEAVADERSAIMGVLETLHHEYFDTSLVGDALRVATGNTLATSRRLERLERRIDGTQARLDGLQADRMNARLSRLTIISAIFLPLTLIAGIYGMNFEVMPELGYPMAYPIALGAMGVLGVGMYVWFWTRGWLE